MDQLGETVAKLCCLDLTLQQLLPILFAGNLVCLSESLPAL